MHAGYALHGLKPGNANLPIGDLLYANREIGVPRHTESREKCSLVDIRRSAKKTARRRRYEKREIRDRSHSFFSTDMDHCEKCGLVLKLYSRVSSPVRELQSSFFHFSCISRTCRAM